jgi:hypothetical protein
MDLRALSSVMESGLRLAHGAGSRAHLGASGVLSEVPGRQIEGLAELMRAKAELRVGSELVRTSDETLGRLLDLLA